MNDELLKAAWRQPFGNLSRCVAKPARKHFRIQRVVLDCLFAGRI